MSGDLHFSFHLVSTRVFWKGCVLQTHAEHTSLKKASLQNSSEHTQAAGRLTLMNRLVKLEGLISVVSWGWNGASWPVREANSFGSSAQLN